MKNFIKYYLLMSCYYFLTMVEIIAFIFALPYFLIADFMDFLEKSLKLKAKNIGYSEEEIQKYINEQK